MENYTIRTEYIPVFMNQYPCQYLYAFPKMKVLTDSMNRVFFILLSLITFSCSGKNAENIKKDDSQFDYVKIFIERNQNPPEMIYPIEYYKSKIIEHRNFFDDRQKISSITHINNIIPDLLCFLVCWDDNLRGNIHELYAFDKKQYVSNKYLVGYGPFLKNYVNKLMKKIPGNKIEHELISFGDFNNDGINEILSYSLYPNIGYVFTVFGYSEIENNFIHICMVPVFINFENTFSPVEYIGNGFKILEIVDNENLELAWNIYMWDKKAIKYVKIHYDN